MQKAPHTTPRAQNTSGITDWKKSQPTLEPPVEVPFSCSPYLPSPEPPPPPPSRSASVRLLPSPLVSSKWKSLEHLQPNPRADILLTCPSLSLVSAGPKEWLRDQKKKAAKFVLAPIEASRQSVRNAYLLLDSLDSGYPKEDSGDVRRLLNSAARDCVPKDRSSLVSLQASSGVEVCTFRLILKNASSLLDDRDPMKLKAEALLSDLISSFSFIGGAVDDSDFQLISDRQKVKDGLLDTISALDKFEQGIKDCLGV